MIVLQNDQPIPFNDLRKRFTPPGGDARRCRVVATRHEIDPLGGVLPADALERFGDHTVAVGTDGEELDMKKPGELDKVRIDILIDNDAVTAAEQGEQADRHGVERAGGDRRVVSVGDDPGALHPAEPRFPVAELAGRVGKVETYAGISGQHLREEILHDAVRLLKGRDKPHFDRPGGGGGVDLVQSGVHGVRHRADGVLRDERAAAGDAVDQIPVAALVVGLCHGGKMHIEKIGQLALGRKLRPL